MDDISAIIQVQRTFFETGETRDVGFRRRSLQKLSRLLGGKRRQILEAVSDDYRRSAVEVEVSEIVPVLFEIELALKHLDKWTKPRRHNVARINRPARAMTMRQPFGLCLIVGPWNYPVHLLLTPLVSSIAAGNCTILKPSEHTRQTAAVLSEVLSSEFDPAYVSVIEGGPESVWAILQAGVDFVFFTGSKKAGEAIMAKAAQAMIPVVLELGGKNPCIVDEGVSFSMAARRVAWGKFFNAGQTCVAPDYCLVRENAADSFLQELAAVIHRFYGPDPQCSPSYGRIVNEHHFDRIVALLADAQIVLGGKHDRQDLYIAPTVIAGIRPGSPLLTEEIFGPLLPVVQYKSIPDALAFIRNRPPSLACYCFSRDNELTRYLEQNFQTGNLCINGTLHMMLTKGMPFGGFGPSGFGRYHEQAGFEAFSYEKAVLRKSSSFEISAIYPPYRTRPGLIQTMRKLLF